MRTVLSISNSFQKYSTLAAEIASQFNLAFNGSASYPQFQTQSALAYVLWLGMSVSGLESDVLAALLKVTVVCVVSSCFLFSAQS